MGSVHFDMRHGRCPLRRGDPEGIPLLGHADLGTVPAEYFCSPCQMKIITIVKRSIRTSRDLWIWWIIFLPILFPACCLICCLKGFRKFTHTCPNCGERVGVTENSLTGKEKCIIATWIGSVILLLTVGYTLLHIFILGGIEWVVYSACFIAAWFGVVICQSCIAAHIFA